MRAHTVCCSWSQHGRMNKYLSRSVYISNVSCLEMAYSYLKMESSEYTRAHQTNQTDRPPTRHLLWNNAKKNYISGEKKNAFDDGARDNNAFNLSKYLIIYNRLRIVTSNSFFSLFTFILLPSFFFNSIMFSFNWIVLGRLNAQHFFCAFQEPFHSFSFSIFKARNKLI